MEVDGIMSEKDTSSFENQQWGKLTKEVAMNSRAEDMLDINNVIDYLKNNIQFREFGETLHLWMDKKRVNQDYLVEYFLQSGKNRETIRKNISNWLASRNIPDRRSLIQLCFALKMTTTEAKELLTRFSDEGWLHIRNPEEVVYYYCLNQGLDFFYAQKLIAESVQINPYRIERLHQTIISLLIEDELNNLTNENELKVFLKKYQSDFVLYRHTAFEYFSGTIADLIDEFEAAPSQIDETELRREMAVHDEAKYNALYTSNFKSDRPIDRLSILSLSNRFRMKLPMSRKLFRYSYIQKSLKQFWPNRQAIIDMLNKRVSVSRKALILAFIIYDGSNNFEEFFDDLNDLLLDCGFHLIDPRSPFDWIVLNSYSNLIEDQSDKLSDCNDFILHEERMSNIIQMLFREQDGIQPIED